MGQLFSVNKKIEKRIFIPPISKFGPLKSISPATDKYGNLLNEDEKPVRFVTAIEFPETFHEFLNVLKNSFQYEWDGVWLRFRGFDNIEFFVYDEYTYKGLLFQTNGQIQTVVLHPP